MKLSPLRKDLLKYLKKHGLTKRWNKIIKLIENDIRHPSLNTELLQPHWRGIYSFELIKNTERFFLSQKEQQKYFRLQIIIKNNISFFSAAPLSTFYNN
jgi:hypothetical protein